MTGTAARAIVLGSAPPVPACDHGVKTQTAGPPGIAQHQWQAHAARRTREVASARASHVSSARTSLCLSAVHPVMRANTSPCSIAPPCSKHHVPVRCRQRGPGHASRTSRIAAQRAIIACARPACLDQREVAFALGCSSPGSAHASIDFRHGRAIASIASGAPSASSSVRSRLWRTVRSCPAGHRCPRRGNAKSAAVMPLLACAGGEVDALSAISRNAVAASSSSAASPRQSAVLTTSSPARPGPCHADAVGQRLRRRVAPPDRCCRPWP